MWLMHQTNYSVTEHHPMKAKFNQGQRQKFIFAVKSSFLLLGERSQVKGSTQEKFRKTVTRGT